MAELERVRLGLLKTTLVDYPGVVAATIFTAGCNLRCPYCHNPDLVAGTQPEEFLPFPTVMSFLTRRKHVLGGVCISGGEPLVNNWLPALADEIHAIGLKVKLDTNGVSPGRIAAVNADYIAMDIKTAPDHYDRVGGAIDVAAAIEAVRSGAPAYEFRTTVVDGMVDQEDIETIVGLLRPGERYVLTAFRPGTTLDPEYARVTRPSDAVLERYRSIALARGLDARIRDHSR